MSVPRLAVSQNGLPTPADILPAFYRVPPHVIKAENQGIVKMKSAGLPMSRLVQPQFLSLLKVIRDLVSAKGGVYSIDSFDDIVRQRSLLNDVEVGIELVEVGCANDDGITMLPIKNTVICSPSQGNSMAANAMLGGNCQSIIRRNLD